MSGRPREVIGGPELFPFHVRVAATSVRDLLHLAVLLASWLMDHIKDVRSFASPRPFLLRLVVGAVFRKARQADIVLRTVKAAEPDAAYHLGGAAVTRDMVLHAYGRNGGGLCGGNLRSLRRLIPTGGTQGERLAAADTCGPPSSHCRL